MRTTLFLLLMAALTASPAWARSPAQSALHVRVTGAAVFDRPGLVHVDSTKVSGTILSSDDRLVRVQLGAPDRVVTIPRPGAELIGVAVSIDHETLVIQVDKSSAAERIPLDAIARVEIDTGKRSNRLWGLWTALSGVGAFFASTAIAFSNCFLDAHCSSGWNVFIIGATAAASVGTAAALHHDGWRTVTIAELSRRITAAMGLTVYPGTWLPRQGFGPA